MNRTINRMLKQMVSKKQNTWDQHLPMIGMAYRSTVHSSTGYTPNMLMLGRECQMPMNIQAPVQQEKAMANGWAGYVVDLKERFETAYTLARENLCGAQVQQKRYYDRKAKAHQYPRGTCV